MQVEVPQSKTSPSATAVKVDCYFSQVNDLAEEAQYDTQDKTLPSKPLHLIKNKKPNCSVYVKWQGIVVVTKGGANFNMPLEQEVEAVFPMAQGLLIQFTIKQDPKFAQILQLQRNRGSMSNIGNDQAKHSYATINKHPLNPLKILGCLRKDQIVPWMNLEDQIIFVSREIPLIISYDSTLQRNAFHLVRSNLQEIQKDSQRVTFLNSSYTLKSISETASPCYELVTDTFFQENTKQERIKEVVITQGKAHNEILLNVLVGSELKTMKVYSVKFFQNCQVNLIAEYPNILLAEPYDLFDSEIHPHTLINPEEETSRFKDIYIQLILRQIRKFKKFLVCTTSSGYALLFNGQIVYNHPQNTQVFDSMRPNPQSIAITSTPGKTNTQHVKKLFDPLVVSILTILSQVLGNQTYNKIISDYIHLNQVKNKGEGELSLLKTYLENLFKEHSGSNDKTKNTGRTQQNILSALHLFYQELKLFEFCNYRQELLDLLFRIAVHYRHESRFLICDYYLREGAIPSSNIALPELVKISQTGYQPIPDVFRFLTDLLQFNKDRADLGVITDVERFPIAFQRTRFVVALFQILVDGETGGRSEVAQIISRGTHSIIGGKDLNSEIYPAFVQSGFYMKYFLQKMQGFNALKQMYEITEVREQKAFLFMIENGLTLHQIKTYPASISTIAHEILRVMREDLPNVLYSVIPKLGFNLIKRQDIHKNIKIYKREVIPLPQHLQNTCLSSTIQTLIHSKTSEDYYLTSNTFEMNKINNDMIFQQVNRLLTSTEQIKIRAKELENIPEDRWQLESQSIVAKFANRRLSVLVGQGAFTWGTSQTFVTEMVKIPKISLSAIMPNDVKVTLDLKQDKESTIHWPQFHNGVASGLRLSKHIIPTSQDHLKTWIFYQKPETPRRDHSGFLLSLGLLGYLRCFSPTDIYQYLKPNNQLTSIALLLGVSASNISRCEQYISQTLIIHVLPSTVDMDIPINVQTSALIGIGLIHKATCNRTMTQMTLSQIGRSPNTDRCLDREGYSLAAGWALGVTCLGMAGKRQNLDDLMLEQRLIRFIEGGKMMEPPQSLISGSFSKQTKCSSIREGPNVNLHITAPSALMALGLMYLKSNNQKINNQIVIPDSFNLIEQCNPNLTLMKVIAKNLIMWKGIENTSEYLQSQIPQLIKFIYQSSLQKVQESYYLVYNVNEIDYHTITTVYASSLTGAAVAMGLKYAGTGDAKAVKVIKDHIDKLKNMKILKYQLTNDPNNKNSIDQYTLFTLLSVSILSLSLIVAGTCDVQCLRIARMLRKKIQNTHSFHYGFNMAINMSIGFICLGYGNYSFNRTDMSIAALLISIYPYFPNSPSDNKWHLQALRHFYVLAVQEKVFHTVDVDTNKVINAKVEMTFQIENSIKQEKIHTPVLLQESKKLLSVRVIDSDYFNVDFAFDQNSLLKAPRVIYIKKKISRNIDLQQFHHLEISQNPEQFQSITTFDREIHFQSLQSLQSSVVPISLLHYMLPNTAAESISRIQSSQQDSQPFKKAGMKQLYYQFLKQDRLDVIEIYLELIKGQGDLKSISLSKLQNLKTIDIFYRNRYLIAGVDNEESQFFSTTKLDSLTKKYKDLVYRELDTLIASGVFAKYLQETKELDSQFHPTLFKVLNYFNVPNRYELQLVRSFLQKLLQESAKNRVPKEQVMKQLSNILEMYLYISFPSCPLNVLDKIAVLYISSN